MADIRGTKGNDTINGTSGADTIRALGGEDQVNGGAGGDLIFGDGSTDYLFGGGGADRLYGGGGADYLTGGRGADRFVFLDTVGDDNPEGTVFAAEIQDFSRGQGDKVDLSNLLEGELPWLGYRDDGGTGSTGGPDDVGVSYRHVTVNGEPQTVLDIRTVDGATGNGYLQIILDGQIDMTPADFLL